MPLWGLGCHLDIRVSDNVNIFPCIHYSDVIQSFCEPLMIFFRAVGTDYCIRRLAIVGTKIKIVLLCVVGVLVLLGGIMSVVDLVQDGVSLDNVLGIFVMVFVSVWLIGDFRSIIQKSKASKEE